MKLVTNMFKLVKLIDHRLVSIKNFFADYLLIVWILSKYQGRKEKEGNLPVATFDERWRW